jgi:hypothetical protein
MLPMTSISLVSNELFVNHLGISALGELVGWALPDKFPPKNNRTSKALYALGNQVRFMAISANPRTREP